MTTMASNVTEFFSNFDAQEDLKFMVEPVNEWSTFQMLLFPFLFILPAEFFAGCSDTLIYLIQDLAGSKGLPGPAKKDRPKLAMQDWCYVWFNRLVMLPFLSFLIVRVCWNSNSIVWGDSSTLTLANGLGGFLVVFSLSDLTYYISHRIVHKVKWLYTFVHKHHHGEPLPIRGWVDTCNAHPTDFFYTGFCTCPISVLWLMPANFIHIYGIMACLYFNSFAGALGHCRLDLNLGFFNTRFHAGHHALTKCNYSQNVEIWDRVFGTFVEWPKPTTSATGVDGKKLQ